MKTAHNTLSVVLLDDDDMSLLQLKQLIVVNNLAKVDASFTCPETFLKTFSMLKFDILILDCDMPRISGREIVEIIGSDRCIINTSSKDKYEEAIKCHPIDILIKPTEIFYLLKAFEKALKLLSKEHKNIEYQLFNVAENKMKVQIKIPDIMYVHSDEIDSRNKDVILRNGQKYTLMDYSFKDLLRIAPDLLQVNHSEAISPEIICSQAFDEIILSEIPGSIIKKSITLSNTYRKEFKNRYRNM